MRILRIALLLVALLVAVHPLFRPYQIAGHSAYVDLSRAEAFHQSVLHGDLSPRWLPDFYFRHGSPIFNFYAPLTYYVIEVFRLIGLDGLWALKATYLLFWLVAALAMFSLTSRMFDADGALAASSAFVLAPYLLVDAYVRNGIAEFAAFAMLALCLLGVWLSTQEEKPGGHILFAFAYAGLTLAHNITAMIATPLLLLFAALVVPNRRAVARTAFAFVCGLALAAFFWLPALAEKNLVQSAESLTGGFFSYAKHFLEPRQLFQRRWGFGASVTGGTDRMGFMFGEMMWFALASGLALSVVLGLRKDFAGMRLRLALSLSSAVALFMTLSWSASVWSRLPLISFVQFPWRFLLPATVFAAPLLGALPAALPKNSRLIAALVLCLASVAASAAFVQVRYVFQDTERMGFAFVHPADGPIADRQPQLMRPDRFLTIQTIRRLGVTSTASNDYLPIRCRAVPAAEATTTAEVLTGSARVVGGAWGYPWLRADVDADTPSTVALNQFYFPGWRTKVDGHPATVGADPDTCRLAVAVGPGLHVIEAHFGDTPPRTVGKIISLLGLAALVVWTWRSRLRGAR